MGKARALLFTLRDPRRLLIDLIKAGPWCILFYKGTPLAEALMIHYRGIARESRWLTSGAYLNTGVQWLELETRMLVCLLSCFCRVRLCVPPWAVDCQAPLHGILQARILRWVAMPSSKGSSPPRDWTHISCSFSNVGGYFTPEPLGKPSKRDRIDQSVRRRKIETRFLLSVLGTWEVACTRWTPLQPQENDEAKATWLMGEGPDWAEKNRWHVY